MSDYGQDPSVEAEFRGSLTTAIRNLREVMYEADALAIHIERGLN